MFDIGLRRLLDLLIIISGYHNYIIISNFIIIKLILNCVCISVRISFQISIQTKWVTAYLLPYQSHFLSAHRDVEIRSFLMVIL